MNAHGEPSKGERNSRNTAERRDSTQRRDSRQRRDGTKRSDTSQRRDSNKPSDTSQRRDSSQRKDSSQRRDTHQRRDSTQRRDSRPRPGSSFQRPAERSRRADPAREAAFQTLRAVDESDAYANLFLPAELRRRHLAGADAAFALELTYGTLRAQGSYDAVIGETSSVPVAELDPPLRDVLRLGMHQLFGLRVPDHAAVNETVALARSEVGAGPARLVNAVLRQAATRPLADWLAQASAQLEAGSASALAIWYSHPAWVVRAMAAALHVHGRPAADLESVLAADNDRPLVTLAARPGLTSPADLAAQIDELGFNAVNPNAENPNAAQPDAANPDTASPNTANPNTADPNTAHPNTAHPNAADPDTTRSDTTRSSTPRSSTAGRLAPTAVELRAGDPGRLPAIRDNLASVQDEASQFVALLAALTPITGPDERWLDLCAGPGGKAALLAALARERGARLVANEVQPHRADLVRRSLGPLLADVEVRCADGREIGREEPGSFDRILLDAPCTGLGALRRRPEARWRKSSSDLPSLTALQRDLLAAALSALRPGGLLAYVTCSPHPAETDAIVAGARRAEPGLQLVSASEAADALRAASAVIGPVPEPFACDPFAPDSYATDVGTAQTWPDRHGTDAMFCALLRKPM